MRWLRQLFVRRRMYADLSEEIREHIEEKVEELVAGGMSKKEAAYAARREFGNVTLTEEVSREVWRWPSIEDSVTDVRYGLRILRKSPTFTLAVVLTLAIGIGGNTATFTLIRAVLLKPLEYRDPDRLVYFSVDNPRRNLQDLSFNTLQFDQMRAGAKSFSALGAYGRPENVMLSKNGEPEALKGARVSPRISSMFSV